LNFFTSVLLGIVQGITEFLPISSSGHLALLQKLFGIDETAGGGVTFSVLLHLGTLISVIVVYRRAIWEMIRNFFSLFGELTGRTPDGRRRSVTLTASRRLLLMIVVATVPLLAAALVSDTIEQLQNSTIAIGAALLITGLVLYLSDRLARGRRNERTASMWHALIVGIAQAFGTVPGISRSGFTISAGLLCGFDRSFAVRFSFLLSIPAVLGANLLTLAKEGLAVSAELAPMYIAGVVTAAVSGIFAIRLVQWAMAKKKFSGFAVYCWTVGLIALVCGLLGA